MAVTRRPNVIEMTAAADATTESVMIMQLLWNASVTVGDDLEIKNTNGDVLLKVKSDGSGFQPIAWPFGRVILSGGFETDVLDAGTVEYILA